MIDRSFSPHQIAVSWDTLPGLDWLTNADLELIPTSSLLSNSVMSQDEQTWTVAKVRRALAQMGKLTKEQRNKIVCGLVGHSRIQELCFGYYTCGRCDAQVGDSLGSVYLGAETAVVIGHNCTKCRENYKTLTGLDKLYVPNPFKRTK